MTKLKLTATLKDAYGNVLSGKPIDFYYSYDGTAYIKITTTSTDADGKAETTHETTRTTWYKARFNGNDVYDPSEAVEKYEAPPILTEYPWLLPLLLILVILGIGIAVFVTRRGR